jgi:two-component system, OmpR family, sensor histidine kinase KdpD
MRTAVQRAYKEARSGDKETTKSTSRAVLARGQAVACARMGIVKLRISRLKSATAARPARVDAGVLGRALHELSPALTWLVGFGLGASWGQARERTRAAHHQQELQSLQATERLQSALLHSISHDLRTPLVTITVALSNLERAGNYLDEATRLTLARTGRQEAERLNRLIGNLLDISRIEAGSLQLRIQPCDVEDAIGAALDQLAPELDAQATELAAGEAGPLLDVDERPVFIEVPAELPPVPMDLALIVQALSNVVDNAVKYSPPESQVDILGRQVDNEIQVEVADRGMGVAPEERGHIFERFYRANRPEGPAGTGLGLAISRGIVEAHGGRIWAEARPGGGTRIIMALPLAPRSPGGG